LWFFLKLLGVIGAALLIAYIIAMGIYPWFHGNWDHVHAVWEHWQSLNGGIIGGILAITASIIAFSISIIQERHKRQRQFLSYRAESLEVLSNFIVYFKECFEYLEYAWRVLDQIEKNETIDYLETSFFHKPESPQYKDTFTPYIATAEGEIDKYLRRFLIKLQIFKSRMRTVMEFMTPSSERPGKSSTFLTHQNILTYLVDLAELHAMVGKLMVYAREDQHPESLNWDRDLKLVLADFWTAFSLHNLGNVIEDADEIFKSKLVFERAIISRTQEEWGSKN
jgi:hypothetical protein